MLAYLTRRLILAVLTVWAVSVLAFVIIQLPPGDYITSYIAQMSASGSSVSQQDADALRHEYGLDRPVWVQYLRWMRLVLRGNFGMALEWQRPVSEVIGDRLWLTMVVSVAAIILTWGLALPIGVYSAVRQYSVGDYVATFIGFIGLAVPSFLLALVLMYLGFKYFNANIGGLFSDEFSEAPWSLAKAWDMAKHLPLPALILGLAGTAQLIRIMRANLLDELRKPYVMTARARGVSERRVILKYPVRVALNPFASTIGYLLPYVVSGKHHRFPRPQSADRGAAPPAVARRPGHVPRRHYRALAWGHDRDWHVPVRPAPDVDRSPYPDGRQAIADPGAVSDAVVRSTTEADLPANVVEERISVATQWQLMWWRFRRHRLAMVATAIVALFYLVVLFADFLAYASPTASEAQRSLLPPQRIAWFDQGRFSPHVHPLIGQRDPVTMKRVYERDRTRKFRVQFFARGFEYHFLGFLPANRHLLGVEGAQPEEILFLLGTDEQGRDLWSRLVYATRTSLVIGLAGVALSLVLGVLLGGISGFYGGAIDTVIQRAIEILRSIPTIPLWMGLAAALPNDWSVLQVYFAITVIISLIGWTELARVVRGRFLSLREEEFVMAAELAGCSRTRIILSHLVPSFMSAHHRGDDTRDPGHGHQRDVAVLPRTRPPATRDQLGRAAAAGAERPGAGHLAVASALRRSR